MHKTITSSRQKRGVALDKTKCGVHVENEMALKEKCVCFQNSIGALFVAFYPFYKQHLHGFFFLFIASFQLFYSVE